MFGDMVEGSPQWWWKYVLPGLISEGLISEQVAERMHPVPIPWRSMIGDRTGPFPEPWRTGVGGARMHPVPIPWRTGVVGEIISVASLKEVARRMQNQELGSQLAEGFERAIEQVIDDTCGNIPRRWPFPWPPKWVIDVVEELTIAANSLEEGSMREELLGVAGRMMDRAASEAGMG